MDVARTLEMEGIVSNGDIMLADILERREVRLSAFCTSLRSRPQEGSADDQLLTVTRGLKLLFKLFPASSTCFRDLLSWATAPEPHCLAAKGSLLVTFTDRLPLPAPSSPTRSVNSASILETQCRKSNNRTAMPQT